MRSVKQFYSSFDFERVVTDGPAPIQEFLDEELRFLKNHIQDHRDILEIGCGYGRLIKELAPKARAIAGVDYSHTLLEKARQELRNHHNVALYLQHAEEFMPKSKFDYVICMDATFGNMPGIEQQVLHNMYDACKSSGEVILSVFSEQARDAQIANYKRIGLTGITDLGNAITTAEGMYSRRFSKKELTELMQVVGLECSVSKLCPINYVAIGRKK